VVVDPEPVFAHGVVATLHGLLTPEPTVCAWDVSVAWPGPQGAAIVGVRRHVAQDTETVIAALKSKTPTIVIGVPGSERAVVDLVRAGAKEVLARDCSPSDLILAVQSLRRGRATTGKAAAVSGPNEPTARELEVTTLLAQGMSNREIAANLFISEHTVRNHLGHVFDKLGVSSRTQAVVRAGQVGWLRLPG
jgi:DNA-binding NarL/FixJ family response regulator